LPHIVSLHPGGSSNNTLSCFVLQKPR